MKHDTDSIKMVMQVIGKDLHTPLPIPPGPHYSWRKTSVTRIDGVAEHFRPGFRTYPERIKDAVSRVFGLLKRYAQPWRNRGK